MRAGNSPARRSTKAPAMTTTPCRILARAIGVLAMLPLLALLGTQASAATSVHFIGNSVTYGAGAAVHFYRADTVTDLNDEGIGGVPALFRAFM